MGGVNREQRTPKGYPCGVDHKPEATTGTRAGNGLPPTAPGPQRRHTTAPKSQMATPGSSTAGPPRGRGHSKWQHASKGGALTGAYAADDAA